MIMRDNWSAVFKDAAGQDVFATGGNKAEKTMDIVTGNTFVNLALVELERAERQNFSLPSLTLSWDTVSVSAPDFGIHDFSQKRQDISADILRWVEQVVDGGPKNELC